MVNDSTALAAIQQKWNDFVQFVSRLPELHESQSAFLERTEDVNIGDLSASECITYDMQKKLLEAEFTAVRYDELRSGILSTINAEIVPVDTFHSILSNLDDYIEPFLHGYRFGAPSGCEHLFLRSQQLNTQQLRRHSLRLKDLKTLYIDNKSDRYSKNNHAESITKMAVPTSTHPPRQDHQIEEIEQFVTLDKAAAFVNRTKRTLERWIGEDQKSPLPDVQGGGGKPNEWKWSTIKSWLENKAGRTLPEKFPTFR